MHLHLAQLTLRIKTQYSLSLHTTRSSFLRCVGGADVQRKRTTATAAAVVAKKNKLMVLAPHVIEYTIHAVTVRYITCAYTNRSTMIFSFFFFYCYCCSFYIYIVLNEIFFPSRAKTRRRKTRLV